MEAGSSIYGLRAELTANLVLKGLCGTIQAAATYATTTNEIWLQDGNFNENVTITNKTYLRLQGGSNSYKHFGNLTLTNCDDLFGLYFGARNVNINYSDYVLLSDINAIGTDQSTIGFYFFNSDVSADYLYAVNSQAGVVCTDGTEADIDESWLGNNLNGLRSYNGSNVDISNTYFCGTGLDLKTYNFSSIEADFCYFDGGSPSTSGSNIQHDRDQSCSLSKVNPAQQTASTNTDNIASSGFEKINSAYFSLNKKLINAFKEKAAFDKEVFCIDYEKVIKDFEAFIKNNPESPLVKIALIASAKSYRRIDDLRGKSDFTDMKNFLTDVIENKEYPALKPQAERLMINHYRLTNDFTGAIETANNLIEKYKEDADYVCGVLYAKGLMLAHNLNQPDKAVESFSLILQQYPENGLAALAENELRILGQEVGGQTKGEGEIAGNEVELNNYPNPFNPVTTINYTLPVDEKVIIKVYDILGREITTLVNDEKPAGTYTVSFDASNLASGIYFYSITAGKFSQIKKMVLAK